MLIMPKENAFNKLQDHKELQSVGSDNFFFGIYHEHFRDLAALK